MKVQGKGINDSTSPVTSDVDGKRIECPFYRTWRSMLYRCYNKKHLENHPTYIDCFVVDKWLTFSNFKNWMEQQDWQGNHLDKDLLIPGNKEYGPNTCMFIEPNVNRFLKGSTSPTVGASWHIVRGKYAARCSNPFTGKMENLGIFFSEEDAHHAWLKRKKEIAMLLAAEQTSEQIRNALITYYDTHRCDR